VTVSGIDASYYWAHDLDRATAFYTTLLGAPPTATYPGVFSEWVFADDTAFGLYKGEEFHAADGVMFSVDDVAAAVAECKARGVNFRGGIEDTPACWMAFGQDSEGNGFILHKRK
jgi:predicted enzyme related to lactoylglutathione lyase